MQLGIVAALRDEARLLTRQPLALRQTVSLGDDVSLQVSGMGHDRARTAGEALIAKGAQALLSWGTAAALDPAILPGTLILPREVFSVDGHNYSVDQAWRDRVLSHLSAAVTIHQGSLCDSDTVLDSPKAKAGLFAQNGCAAVDMESAALARLASERGLPFLSLRYIVDPADMTLPVSLMKSLDDDGQVRLLKLSAQLITHPRDLLALARLGKAFGQAKHSMQLTINTLGPELGFQASARSAPV
jgi:adenosylhomocysteine nucleosidase